ncbi:Mfa1 family fimbria major subunit [Parabacteroides goldsteinii]
MKVKSLLLTVLAAALFTGCSDSEGDSPDPSMIGRAFLSLSLQSTTGPSTRATGSIEEKPGTSDESKAGEVKVLLFDEHDLCLGVVPVTGATIGNSSGDGNPTAAATDAIVVPPKTAKVFVVINPYTTGWDFTEDKVKNKTWDEINTTLTDAKIENVATDKKFMMASAGYEKAADKTTTDKGALTDVTANIKIPDDYTTEKIEAAKTEAKGSPAVVNVDRLASKVTVTKAAEVDFTIAPTGAKFTFQGWELSVTNKSVRLYSDLVDYDNKTTGAVYRKDKNYLENEQPKNPTELRAAFDYLKNIDNTSEDIPEVTRTSATSAYCLENTMEAKAQKLGFTTKVVVKAQYTPNGITENTSYFSWNGKYYTLTTLKEEYNKDGSGLKTDLPKFLHKAKLMTDDVFNGNQTGKDNAVATLTAADFTAKTGIIGRYCAVRYYHESVCYYDVLIRHDKSIEQKMALGRWGVVRNNWYSIELKSVTGPGTPWIPDPSDPDPTDPTKPDPENPTGPDIDDDENDAYLSVKITINPWTFWTQEANLH